MRNKHTGIVVKYGRGGVAEVEVEVKVKDVSH